MGSETAMAVATIPQTDRLGTIPSWTQARLPSLIGPDFHEADFWLTWFCVAQLPSGARFAWNNSVCDEWADVARAFFVEHTALTRFPVALTIRNPQVSA